MVFDPDRIQRYDQYEHVYRNRHERVWDRLEGDSEFPNVKINLPAAIIKNLANLVTSKTPVFKTRTAVSQNRLDKILEQSNFGCELSKFVLQGLLLGDSVLKVQAKQDQVVLKTLTPRIWVPEVPEDDADNPTGHILYFVRKPQSGPMLVLLEIHRPFFIENRIHILNGKDLGPQLSSEEAAQWVPEWLFIEPLIETQVDQPLIYTWNPDKLPGETFGTSILLDIWDEIFALDERTTQENRILTKHADPKLLIRQDMVNENPDGSITIKDLDVLKIPVGTTLREAVGYAEFDGKLEHVDRSISRLRESMLIQTGVAPLLVGAGGPQDRAETGLAVVSKLLPTLFRVDGIQKELEGPLINALMGAQKLSSVIGSSFTPSPVRIEEWGVKLPMDLQTIVATEIQQVQAEIKTPAEAREDIDRHKSS